MTTTRVLSEYMTEYMTGRHRFREDSFGSPVYQIEVSRFYASNTEFAGKWVCSFRDATIDDLKKMGETVV